MAQPDIWWVHLDYNVSSAPFVSELSLWGLNWEFWAEKSRSRAWQYHQILHCTPKYWKFQIFTVFEETKFLNSTLKVSIQKQKEQSWRYNLSVPPTHHHQKLFKADRWLIITLYQLTLITTLATIEILPFWLKIILFSYQVFS